ncbi:phosphoglycerate mutase-like protein, partial [Genlisea aurea]
IMGEELVYPLNRCKIIHLVRHGQALHNVAVEKGDTGYSSSRFFDAELSPRGLQQVVDGLRTSVRSSDLCSRIELVVVSPLMRTLQTAAGVFGGDGIDAPFVALELCRERLGVNWCDKRRNIAEYKSLFPHIDFSQIESDEDALWTPDYRESDEEIRARGIQFFDWLCGREEKEIAVVSHSAFLNQTLAVYGGRDPSVEAEIGQPFSNCELRSIVLVDR